MAHLIELAAVGKSFTGADGTPRRILDGVDFQLREGEIVALLGKSGSGKSTLLRIIAGLVPADGGTASYNARPIAGPAPGVAMVFQSFALFPWLTVQQNVELGLEAQGVAPKEREKRADAMLELIGLSGFGGALPRELSGGMRQRVGIARALVTNPDVLLMDEAFSALDVLTGETLRNDILELWDSQQIPTRGIVVVSHNIEEAVMMADRIIILSSDPGRIVSEVKIDLPRPRTGEAARVRELIDEVYGLMTRRRVLATVTDYNLPDTDVSRIEAVLELIAQPPFNGHADLPQLAEETELSDEELFPTFEALAMLGFAQVDSGDISLTALGLAYADAEQAERQDVFGRQVLANVPLAGRIRAALDASESGALSENPFIELLEESMKETRAQRTLGIAVEWGRYGELYEYDFRGKRLTLPETDPAHGQ
ncbi:MAG: nitrate/sulfonate/bicarbonate ABC transporter ATP-binding protein [Pseudomonadota bacterium]|nr:nitrate/sulfonate/bicarbonate ABC transporter ATP-binding protein [Pseudomonadota bacterium]